MGSLVCVCGVRCQRRGTGTGVARQRPPGASRRAAGLSKRVVCRCRCAWGRAQSLQHNPNGRFVTVCGDGEFVVYTALAWRNKSFGSVSGTRARTLPSAALLPPDPVELAAGRTASGA